MFRRDFLSQLSAATPLLAASPAPAAAKPSAGPSRHQQDDWLDRAPEKHRLIFDSWLADKVGEATGFAGNWAKINKEQYGVTEERGYAVVSIG